MLFQYFVPEMWHRSIINMVWHALSEGRGTYIVPTIMTCGHIGHIAQTIMTFVLFRKHREDQRDDTLNLSAHFRLQGKILDIHRYINTSAYEMTISGTHSFPTFIHHKECKHGPLPSSDRKPYMAPGQKLTVLYLTKYLCKYLDFNQPNVVKRPSLLPNVK